MRSGSLVLFFAAAFGSLKGADSESDTLAENNVVSFSDAQNNPVPEQKDNKTRSGTGEELVLHQEHLHPGLAKKGPGFYVTGSGAAYFLMKYFEAIWRRENKTTQARRLAAENTVFNDVEEAMEATNKMKETLENTANAALKLHIRHHDNRSAEKDPQLKSLRLAVIDALRLLKRIMKLMAPLQLQAPTLVKLLESKLDELARSIGRTKKLLVEIVVQKEVFARIYVEAAQKELEEMKIATLNHKAHSAKKFVAYPKTMRDAVVAEVETLVEEILFQASQADQPQPVQPDYAKAKELAKTAKIFILQLEAYILSLRELNEAHRDALTRVALELDFARAAVAGLPQLIDILEIIGDSIDL